MLDPTEHPQVRDVRALTLPPGWHGWDLALAPPSPFDHLGYPVEPVRIVMLDEGEVPYSNSAPVRTYPRRSRDRSWKHKNEHPGDLCLWYPHDPPSQRWERTDGICEYIAIVQRHLLSEEAARRNGGLWRGYEAPHGHPRERPKVCRWNS